MAPNNQVRYPELAHRISEKIRQNPEIPQEYGQLMWFVSEFKRRYDVTIGREQIRTWLKGLREPRAESRAQLAEILGVDVGWLMGGTSAPSIGRTSNSASEMVVAMMLKSAGWTIRSAKDRSYDMDAEIAGRAYKIEATQAVQKGDLWEVKLSRYAEQVVTVATIVDPVRGELALLLVEGNAGEVAQFKFDGDEIVAVKGSVQRLTNLTKPI